MSKRTKTIAPYGAWKSPVDIDLVLAKSVGLSEPRYHNGELFWLESRPHEGGRQVICRRTQAGDYRDVLPLSDSDGHVLNASTRVHEYGGGSWMVSDYSGVFFTNLDRSDKQHTDQRVHWINVNGDRPPVAFTPSGVRFADMHDDPVRPRFVAVAEDHRQGEVKNFLAAVSYFAGTVTTLAEGYDFYASPCISPDAQWIAWVCWNHPNMPWDDTELWLARVGADGKLCDARKIAGGKDESVLHPRWSPDSKRLYFISDRSNWWNIYHIDFAQESCDWPSAEATCLLPMKKEFCGPMWGLGASPYAVLKDGRIACSYKGRDGAQVSIVGADGSVVTQMGLPYSRVAEITAGDNAIALTVGSPTAPMALIEIKLDPVKWSVVKKSSDLQIDPGYISKPRSIRVPTSPLPNSKRRRTAREVTHALFYPPANRDFAAPRSELPPLVVFIHGGPTAAASDVLKYSVQYWTSRGFAVADVNYRGSTGFGRAYRKKLQGNWGVIDWQDCEAVARHLVKRGLVDGKRLAIEGGSAGGFTTLAALAFGSVFTAGCSLYGVSDLTALAKDTHKFEARYLDGLIGPYPAAQQTYIERSPLRAVQKITAPVLFLQGMVDEIVPPNQTRMMVDALRDNQVPVAVIYFEGEPHGFRKAENIKRSLLAEFWFFAHVFGIEPADHIEPVVFEYPQTS